MKSDSLLSFRRPLLIGMVGSIGVGKSTVLKALAQYRIPTFPLDTIVSSVYQNSSLWKKLISFLPTPPKNKEELGYYLFEDPILHKKWTDTLYPSVRQYTLSQIYLKCPNIPYVVIELPIISSFWKKFLYDTIILLAPFNLQKERLEAREGSSYLKSLLWESRATNESYLIDKNSTFLVLENRKDLKKSIAKIHYRYCREAQHKKLYAP